MTMGGETVADLPIDPLAQAAPEYDRPWTPGKARPVVAAADVPERPWGEALTALIGGPRGCSRRWVWEQYDHMVMGDTVGRPGGDAALVRIHGTKKGLV